MAVNTRLMSLFHTNFRAMFYSAQQWFSFRKASYLIGFYCSPPTHNFPQTYYSTIFFTVLISSFEQRSLVLGSVALRDKVFEAEALETLCD